MYDKRGCAVVGVVGQCRAVGARGVGLRGQAVSKDCDLRRIIFDNDAAVCGKALFVGCVACFIAAFDFHCAFEVGRNADLCLIACVLAAAYFCRSCNDAFCVLRGGKGVCYGIHAALLLCYGYCDKQAFFADNPVPKVSMPFLVGRFAKHGFSCVKFCGHCRFSFLACSVHCLEGIGVFSVCKPCVKYPISCIAVHVCAVFGGSCVRYRRIGCFAVFFDIERGHCLVVGIGECDCKAVVPVVFADCCPCTVGQNGFERRRFVVCPLGIKGDVVFEQAFACFAHKMPLVIESSFLIPAFQNVACLFRLLCLHGAAMP